MKNTLTKVLTIVAAGLVVLVAITAILLSFIKTNFNQVIDTSKIDSVTVILSANKSNNYASNAESSKDREVFNKIKELYNKGTEESIISALFQGAYSEEAKAELLSNSVSQTTMENPKEGTIVLKLYLKEDMQLKLNGEVVEDKSKTTATDKSIYYNTVYVNIENHTTLTKIKCFVVSKTSTYSYRQVAFVAHHSELYDYLSNLNFPG